MISLIHDGQSKEGTGDEPNVVIAWYVISGQFLPARVREHAIELFDILTVSSHLSARDEDLRIEKTHSLLSRSALPLSNISPRNTTASGRVASAVRHALRS